jgi:hypothetical protein
VVFKPSRMTTEQLQDGFHWANHQFYSHPSIWKRLSGTSQRLIPRWEMNREFRKLVKRTRPKVSLSPLAGVLENLQTKLPVFDKEQLFPSAVHALKQAIDPNALSAQQLTFHIKAKRHDKFAVLFVDLDDTLDRLNALELIKRIKEAANQVRMHVIVNFEHLKLVTQDALKALVDSEAMKVTIPNVRVRFRKFKDAFGAFLEGFSLAGLQGFSLVRREHLNEDLQDA